MNENNKIIKKRIKVVVAGCAGKMGLESVKTILNDTELELVGAVTRKGSIHVGKNISELVSIQDATDVNISDNLKYVLQSENPDVMLDFTVPGAVYDNAIISLDAGARPILGATGLLNDDMLELEKKANMLNSAVLIVPNFAIGAVLMIESAKRIAKYFDWAEIIEMHHENKLDAPSGTSVKTASEISKIIAGKHPELSHNQKPRGELIDKVRVHSLRMPGFIADQKVVFGGQGQTLTISHSTIDRSAFMPGVALAIKGVLHKHGLIYGLEHLLHD